MDPHAPRFLPFGACHVVGRDVHIFGVAFAYSVLPCDSFSVVPSWSGSRTPGGAGAMEAGCPRDTGAVLPQDDPSGTPGTIAYAGVDPTLDGRVREDALRRAIATRGRYCPWNVDYADWVVTRHYNEHYVKTARRPGWIARAAHPCHAPSRSTRTRPTAAAGGDLPLRA
jgi:hypothetical protein